MQNSKCNTTCMTEEIRVNMKNAFSMSSKQREQIVRVLEASCSALLSLLRNSMEMQEIVHSFR